MAKARPTLMGDLARLPGILSKLYKVYDQFKEGKEPTQEDAPPEEDLECLQRLAYKVGWNIDIARNAFETIEALNKLEPHLNNSDPADMVDMCFKESPTVAHLIAEDPAGCWAWVSKFFPKGEPGSETAYRREWVHQVFVELEQAVLSGRYPRRPELKHDKGYDPYALPMQA